MQVIRSILWIGPYEGLLRNGLMQAEQLDVVWVPDAAAASELAGARFEVAVVAMDEPAKQRDAVISCGAQADMPPLVVLTSLAEEESLREQLAIDGGELLVEERRSGGPRFAAELKERIERLARQRGAIERGEPPQHSAVAGAQIGHGIIGHSEALRAAYDLAERAANGTTTVLLHGETGTGKEIFAKAIHQLSTRSRERFVAVNCAAIPDALLESELFGHVRGSFTGANANKTGLFELARGGTLFLDEVGETSTPLQAKLLRALQEKEIRPVGGNHDKKIDVRIIAASNRDLRVEATQGVFREDLFYRLAVFPISIPPLRKRAGDIVLIAQHFLGLYGRHPDETCAAGRPSRLSQAAAELLLTYPWPGNVRELENEIQRAITLAGPGNLISPDYLSDSVRNVAAPVTSEEHIGKTLREIVAQVEAQVIRRTLANHSGRRARSAKALGITREGLYKKMRRLGLQ